MDTKKCNTCNEELPVTDFGPHKKAPDGLAYHCRPCMAAKSREYESQNKEKRRSTYMKYRYGITSEQYDEAWRRQGEGCAICGSDRKPRIDHCHETGKFRGILCDTCNRGLGMLGDNLGSLEKAVKYLTGD